MSNLRYSVGRLERKSTIRTYFVIADGGTNDERESELLEGQEIDAVGMDVIVAERKIFSKPDPEGLSSEGMPHLEGYRTARIGMSGCGRHSGKDCKRTDDTDEHSTHC